MSVTVHPAQMVQVGALRGPHGLQGLVKAKLKLDDPNLLCTCGGFVDAAGQAWQVQSLQPAGAGLWALRLAGVTTPEQAQNLRGPIWMDASRWPHDPDQPFVSDCLGWPVWHNAVEVGKVVAVQELPAYVAGVVARPDGTRRLVPMIPDCWQWGHNQITLTDLGAAYLNL